MDGFLKEGYTCDSWQFYDDSSIIVLQYRDSDSYLTIYDFIKEQTVVETPLSSGMTDGRLRKLKQDEKTTYAVLSRVKGFAKNDYNNYQYDCYDSNLQIMDSTAIVFPEKAYLDGPTVVTDDKHILYEHSDTQKQKLYIADADGSNERLLLDTDKDFGGGFIWYIECRGDYFTFNTMGGAGIFHIPTEKYHHILGGFDTYLCDGGKQYITGNTYSGKLGTIPPMLYDATADTLTTYDKLNGGLFFGVSDNSRYLYDVGLIWPITDYCTINVFDRETEQLYTENFEPEGFSVLPDVQEENHNISDDGKYLIYPSRNGQFLLLEVKWENNANHLPSDTK